MNELNIKKDFVDGKVLPAQDLNSNFIKIENSVKNLQGATAYDIAVQQGFVGTEEEWLATLVGPQGPKGPQGTPGKAGSSIGYIKGSMLRPQGGVPFGFKGSAKVNDYIVQTTNGLSAYIADTIEDEGNFPTRPTKGIYVNTKDISVLKVFIKGDIIISPGDAHRLRIRVASSEYVEKPTKGWGNIVYKDLSQIPDNNYQATTSIEMTSFFDVSEYETVILYIEMLANTLDNIGTAEGTCTTSEFDFFVEGYQ